jgi:hypothetical protein
MTKHVWYLHPKVSLQLNLPAAQVYNLLEMNSKPSIKRLEYRKLYAAGRRYLMRSDGKGGFSMMTTEKVWWHPRARTRASTVLHGDFETLDAESSRLTLRSNIRLHYLLDVFPIPTFFTSIVVYMWWPVWLLTFLVLALYLLSWLGHRLHALLEAHEMRFFIETILQEYMPNPPAQLQGVSNIVMSKDFEQVWDKFVEEMSEKDTLE